jgi:putative transposase
MLANILHDLCSISSLDHHYYRITTQIYSCIIAYLILQLIDIEEGFGKSLLDKLRYLQSFMCQYTSYIHWFRRIVFAS